MSHALTLEQYREWVNNYLDQLEELDEEQAIVVGGLTGNVNTSAPSQKYDSKRIRGAIGYPSELWSQPSGVHPLGDVVAGHIDRTRLLGTIVVPRSELSEEAEERIEEQQGDLEAARGEESDE